MTRSTPAPFSPPITTNPSIGRRARGHVQYARSSQRMVTRSGSSAPCALRNAQPVFNVPFSRYTFLDCGAFQTATALTASAARPPTRPNFCCLPHRRTSNQRFRNPGRLHRPDGSRSRFNDAPASAEALYTSKICTSSTRPMMFFRRLYQVFTIGLFTRSWRLRALRSN